MCDYQWGKTVSWVWYLPWLHCVSGNRGGSTEHHFSSLQGWTPVSWSRAHCVWCVCWTVSCSLFSPGSQWQHKPSCNCVSTAPDLFGLWCAQPLHVVHFWSLCPPAPSAQTKDLFQVQTLPCLVTTSQRRVPTTLTSSHTGMMSFPVYSWKG